jgi:hypothetical protein
MMAGFDGVEPGEILLLTLTAPGEPGLAHVWNRTASIRWNAFITYLRRAFPGACIEFWKVGEIQERGLVHYHVVLRGLRFLPVELLRRLAVQAGFGPWVWIGRPERAKGGVKGLLGYYGKYMVKGTRRWWLMQHVVTHSRSWRQNWVQRGSNGGRLWDGSAECPWSYCACEYDAYVILKHREASQRGQSEAIALLRASVPPLTAGLSPPVSLEKGGAVP